MAYYLVYGTLKQRHGNHGVLANSQFIDEAVTDEDVFSMFDGGFPFVSDKDFGNDNTGRIVGELYQVDDSAVEANLDRLEGVPSLYVKREVDVTTMSGLTYKANIYVASRGSNERLAQRTAMEPKGRSKLLEWR